MRTIDEVDDMLNKVIIMNDFSGMTYKEGLRLALEWVLEINEDDPTE